MVKIYTPNISDYNGSKTCTLPLEAEHTYPAYIGEYRPPPRRGNESYQQIQLLQSRRLWYINLAAECCLCCFHFSPRLQGAFEV